MRIIKQSEIEAVSGGSLPALLTVTPDDMCGLAGAAGKDIGSKVGGAMGGTLGTVYGVEVGGTIGAAGGALFGAPEAGALVGAAVGKKYGQQAGKAAGGYAGGKVGESVGDFACGLEMDYILGSSTRDGSKSGQMEMAEEMMMTA